MSDVRRRGRRAALAIADRTFVARTQIAWSFAALALLAAVSGAGSPAPAGRQSSSAAARAPAASAIVPYAGFCDTSDVLGLLGDLKDDGRKHDQLAVLQGRIIDCSRRIATARAELPAPTPTPYWIGRGAAPVAVATPQPICATPPPDVTAASNRFALYETLTQCFAYLTYLRALPTPAPVESPLPSIASQPTFYVFATGAVESAAAAVLIRSIVGKLTQARDAAHAAEPLAISGRGDWTDPSGFADQCKYDPNTRGALVIETSIPETSHRNYLLLIADITNISASVEMLGCADDDHTPAGSPLSLWSANGLTGKAHETALTSGILSAVAALFLTDRSSTMVSVANKNVSVATSQRSAPVISGSVSGYLQNQNLNIPAQNATTGLRVASERFAQSTLERLQLFCAAPDVLRAAAAARPSDGPAPPDHRTVRYKAAALYIDDCARFGGFVTHP